VSAAGASSDGRSSWRLLRVLLGFSHASMISFAGQIVILRRWAAPIFRRLSRSAVTSTRMHRSSTLSTSTTSVREDIEIVETQYPEDLRLNLHDSAPMFPPGPHAPLHCVYSEQGHGGPHRTNRDNVASAGSSYPSVQARFRGVGTKSSNTYGRRS
jgi:hypothetical protein